MTDERIYVSDGVAGIESGYVDISEVKQAHEALRDDGWMPDRIYSCPSQTGVNRALRRLYGMEFVFTSPLRISPFGAVVVDSDGLYDLKVKLWGLPEIEDYDK